MAGKITTIQPLGNQATSPINKNQIPQQLGGTIFGAGNVVQNSHGQNRTDYISSPAVGRAPSSTDFAKNRVYLAVSPADSGNVGTFKPLANGNWNGQRKGQYIMFGNTFWLGGKANSLMSAPHQGAPYTRGFGNQAKGDTALDIVSWDYVTGAPNYGPNNGSGFAYVAPIGGGALAMEQFPNNLVSGSGAIPSHLVFMVTGTVPASSVYGPRHDI